MSAIPPTGLGGMPPAIRNGGPQARAMYAVGLAFEQQLIQNLTASLDLTGSGAEGNTDADTDANANADSNPIVTSMLPQALAQSLTDAGGFGLAPQLAEPYVDHSPNDG